MPRGVHEQATKEPVSDALRAYRRAYSRRRRRELAAGTYQPPVPVDEVRPHLVWLRTQGMAEKTIAAMASTCPETVGRILQRKVNRVYGSTAAALLSVKPALEVRPNRVHVAGTARRLRWLCVMGWPLTELARRSRIPHQTLWFWAHERRSSVPVEGARVIAAVYDDLYAVDGPSGLTRDAAERNGWHELVWLDDNIDDPSAAPLNPATLVDEVIVDRILDGDRALIQTLKSSKPASWSTLPEIEEAVRRGTDAGASQADLAELLSTSTRQVSRIRARVRPAECAEATTVLKSEPISVEAQDAAPKPTRARGRIRVRPVRDARRLGGRQPGRDRSRQARHHRSGALRRRPRHLRSRLHAARWHVAGVVAVSGTRPRRLRQRNVLVLGR